VQDSGKGRRAGLVPEKNLRQDLIQDMPVPFLCMAVRSCIEMTGLRAAMKIPKKIFTGES
jgi:hypothetical protein